MEELTRKLVLVSCPSDTSLNQYVKRLIRRLLTTTNFYGTKIKMEIEKSRKYKEFNKAEKNNV